MNPTPELVKAVDRDRSRRSPGGEYFDLVACILLLLLVLL